MNTTHPTRTPRQRPLKLVLTILAVGGAFAADAFVLRTAWNGRQLEEGQFRRGYFERFGDDVGIAADGAIRPDMVPTFVLESGGNLSMPPGLIAVAPMAAGVRYELARGGALAPYVVTGIEAPLAPDSPSLSVMPDEGRLVEARTLTLQDGRLALERWDPNLPWRNDADRLAALHEACAGSDDATSLQVARLDNGIEFRLGRCALLDPLPVANRMPLLAVLAGPAWLSVTRSPAWVGERWVAWPVLAVIAAKIALFWWGLGLVSVVAVSAALALPAIFLPVPALLMWPIMAIVGAIGAAAKAAQWAWRRIPQRARVPAFVALLALIGGVLARRLTSAEEATPIVYEGHSSNSVCTVIGYSTVKGEGLRQGRGGIRSVLNERCSPLCEDQTAAMFAGGETMAWARDSYCNSPDSFGANGHVIFLGSVNDDYFWGYLSLPRLFVAGQEGGQSWRGNEGPAAAASLARIGAYEAALNAFMDCVRARQSRLLFLHDFLVTDLDGGRKPERAAMLDRRRAAVQAGGGTFVDLAQVFGSEAGLAWFNDYVHLSQVGHERVADLACRLMKTNVPQATVGRSE